MHIHSTALREYARETYDEPINKLLGLVPSGEEEGEYTAEFRASWIRAHEDLRKPPGSFTVFNTRTQSG